MTMDWLKASVLAACLALPATSGAVAADQTTDAKPATPAATTKASDVSGKPSLSKDEIRKLEAKCSDEADAKHLHGEPRKMFRNACKSRGGL